MTPIADMVEQMLADGIAASAIVLAVRTAETCVSRDVTQNVSRDGLSMSPGAVRSRRHRTKLHEIEQTAKANDVAQCPVSERSAERSAERNAVSISIQEEGTIEKASEVSKKEVVTRARGTHLADDWQPNDSAVEFARGLGLDPKALRDEFVDFWSAVPGSRGLKLDWQKTYKNRAREVSGRNKRFNQNRNNVIPAADALVETMRQWERQDDSLLENVRGGEGETNVRLLSSHRGG